MKKIKCSYLCITLVLLSTNANSLEISTGNSKFSFGGYIKTDYINLEGAGSDGSFNKTLSLPSQVTEDSNGSRAGIQSIESRFNFKTSTKTDLGTATSFLEMDFFLSPGGNEKVSNSNNPRLRHAFFNLNGWTFGQTWSTFATIFALPEQLDFGGWIGNALVRQSMMKYSTKIADLNWDLALENGETTTESAIENSTTTPSGTDQDNRPDIITKLTKSSDKYKLALSAMVRNLRIDDNTIDVKDDIWSYAMSLGTKYSISSSDTLSLSVNWGNLGRYLAPTAFKDLQIKSVNNKVELNATTQLAWSAGLKHMWNDTWRSNISFANASQDEKSQGAIDSISKWSINLLNQPMKQLLYGVEVSDITIQRFAANSSTVKPNEVSGKRYQFSIKYTY